MIDGRVLFPFTGHIVLAWKALCKVKSLNFQKTPIIIENMNVYQPTILTKAGIAISLLFETLFAINVTVKLHVFVLPSNGHFEIMDGSQLVASGFIFIVEHDHPFYNSDINKIHISDIAEEIELNAEDIYKEFLLRGYEYGQAFWYQSLSF